MDDITTKKEIRISHYIVFGVFAFFIFVQCILFHYSCFGYIAFSSLWKSPSEFFAFYGSKLLPAVFIASFIFLSKRYWWSIIMSVLIALWMIANIIYFRANELFINTDAMAMVDNMDGFWSSIWLYVNWECVAIFVISIFYVLFVSVMCRGGERNWRKYGISAGCAVLLYVVNLLVGSDYDMKHAPRPGDWPKYKGLFVTPRYAAAGYYALWESGYIEASSVLQYAVAESVFAIDKLIAGEPEIHFSDADYSLMDKLVNGENDEKSVAPKSNLIVIIVESLESWPIGLTDIYGTPVAPNLDRIIKGECLYCPNIKSQVLQGTSGDGQMIINTGLLPIQPGAACVKYGTNMYPGFAHLYACGGVLYPNNAWNQTVVSESYGYKFSRKPKPSTGKDEVIFDMLESYIDTSSSPYCVQAITISMHGPFDRIDYNALSFEDGFSNDLAKYFNCLHYTDSCIGLFWNKLENDSLLRNTTVGITGDHTVFKYSTLRDYQPYAEKYNMPIPKEESYCPLIIYSPEIKEHMEVNDLCFQMDIYPTIMHCIGATDYYWKGFGVNLTDSVVRNNRLITVDEAYSLSDKIIRSDFFRMRKEKDLP